MNKKNIKSNISLDNHLCDTRNSYSYIIFSDIIEDIRYNMPKKINKDPVLGKMSSFITLIMGCVLTIIIDKSIGYFQNGLPLDESILVSGVVLILCLAVWFKMDKDESAVIENTNIRIDDINRLLNRIDNTQKRYTDIKEDGIPVK